jgi:uncharacterized protein (DUF3820 family)
MIDLNPSKSVVPFGKYKGQPVEILAQDKPYLDWLSAQDWFRERYSGIYTLIVNNFSESSETPEHNSLQVLFLDDEFCFAFVKAAAGPWLLGLKTEPARRVEEWATSALINVERDYDASVKQSISDNSQYIRDRSRRLAKRSRELREILGKIPQVLTYGVKWTKEFEHKGVDVVLSCHVKSIEQLPNVATEVLAHHTDYKHFEIEIKPTVGDDYPAILRQMKANKARYLFTQRYTGVGATKEQFVQTMKLSGVTVVFQESLELEKT